MVHQFQLKFYQGEHILQYQLNFDAFLKVTIPENEI